MNRLPVGRKAIIFKHEKPEFRAPQYERSVVSAEEVQEIKEAFDLFDPEHTGFVSTAELLASLDSVSSQVRQQPLYHMIASGRQQTQIPGHDDKPSLQQRHQERHAQGVQLFDEEHSGFFSLKTLKVVKELGENIDEAELQEMIEKAGLDKDGQVSEQEFTIS